MSILIKQLVQTIKNKVLVVLDKLFNKTNFICYHISSRFSLSFELYMMAIKSPGSEFGNVATYSTSLVLNLFCMFIVYMKSLVKVFVFHSYDINSIVFIVTGSQHSTNTFNLLVLSVINQSAILHFSKVTFVLV